MYGVHSHTHLELCLRSPPHWIAGTKPTAVNDITQTVQPQKRIQKVALGMKPVAEHRTSQLMSST